jgi:hypothetical protein
MLVQIPDSLQHVRPITTLLYRRLSFTENQEFDLKISLICKVVRLRSTTSSKPVLF